MNAFQVLSFICFLITIALLREAMSATLEKRGSCEDERSEPALVKVWDRHFIQDVISSAGTIPVNELWEVQRKKKTSVTPESSPSP